MVPHPVDARSALFRLNQLSTTAARPHIATC